MESLLDFPVEILLGILRYLDFVSASALCQTCRYYYETIPELYTNHYSFIVNYQGTRQWPGVYMRGQTLCSTMETCMQQAATIRALRYHSHDEARVPSPLPWMPRLTYARFYVGLFSFENIFAILYAVCAAATHLQTLVVDLSLRIPSTQPFAHIPIVHIQNAGYIDVQYLRHATEVDVSRSNIDNVQALCHVHTVKLVGCTVVGTQSLTDISGLTHVVDLDISQTDVQDVSGLIHVKKLILRECYRVYDVSALQQLEYLDMRGTSIRSVSMLPRLRVLYGTPFALPMAQLEKFIYVDHNVLCLPPLLWFCFKALHTLNVAGMELIGHTDIVHLKHVQRLDISNTAIDVLPAGMRVQVLRIRNCPIQDVSMLTHVEILHMRGTKATKVCGLLHLRALSVEASRVTTLVNLPKLKYLNISNSRVTQMDHLPALTVLGCSDCMLHSIIPFPTITSFYQRYISKSSIAYLPTQKRFERDIPSHYFGNTYFL